MAESPHSQRSVLELIADRTGRAPKVLLSDLDSEHGPTPVVDPSSAASKLVPHGRGNYQLLGEIARGGMGVILKGHDTDLGRDVAVKVLDGELAKRPEVVQRFVEEAQIGGQLQHPGIVPVYELGLMADERPYFTMKLVKGRTLAALFQQRKTPAENRGRLLAIFESVCQTMAYAHSKGVLHRDLKPANVMVGAFGEVQVVDWGLAKVMRRGGVADEKRAKDSLLTVIETVRSGSGSSGSDSMIGSVMGTPAYMAPEQAQGEVDLLDERADVFSLGAILCELLTGRPPYEPIDGETLLKQAAKAKLGPARTRLEACDADRALVQLCLDCMMTAREARPTNAGEVAKAVHEYLASVEERAQKAELAAEKARIKAAEERRARRLTLALAGTIVVAIGLGGVAWYWIEHERAQREAERAARVEQTRAAVEAAYGESIELGQAGKPDEALAAARRALSLAEGGAADAALLDRTRHFVDNAELAVGAAERERKLTEQDETLRSRLIDLRVQQIGTFGDAKREIALDTEFAKAFRDYGVDLEGADVVAALARIRQRKIAREVALALDDWGRLRRKVHGAKSEKAENLLVLALDLDGDPTRRRLREAVAAEDIDVMLELSAPESLRKLEPGSIFVLATALWEGAESRRPDVFRILDFALDLCPGDFVLQAAAGSFYHDSGRFEEAVACRSAAVSLRAKDAGARVRLSDSLYFAGRFSESAEVARACLAIDPNHAEALYFLAGAQQALGDYAGALVDVTRSVELEDDPMKRLDLEVAQFYNGVLSRDDIARNVASASAPLALATYLYPLLDHPDPAQRDPEFVLRTLEEHAASLSTFRWVPVLQAVAYVRLEDWSRALTAIENRFRLPQFMLLSPMAYDFLRSLIHSRVGRDLEAHAYYQRGMVAWDAQTADDPEVWARSDAMRWRREAEAALAK